VTVFYDPDNPMKNDLFNYVSQPDDFLFLILGIAIILFGFKWHYGNMKSSDSP